MGGAENNPNPMYTIWVLGELSPLQREILCSLGTYLRKCRLSFSSSQKKSNTVKNYQECRPPQNTPLSQHLNDRHCTLNMLSSLHAVLHSQKRRKRTRKGRENKDDQRYETGSVQGTKQTWIFQPGRQMIKVVSKRSVINGAA